MNIHRSLPTSGMHRIDLRPLSSILNSLSEAVAQSFPSNPIRIVVPTAPSTPPDIISRVVAAELTESEGWRVIVENKPGAVQTIGLAEVLKQPADGYSLYALSAAGVAPRRPSCRTCHSGWMPTSRR